jgi:superfamily II DNA helicase RecQ
MELRIRKREFAKKGSDDSGGGRKAKAPRQKKSDASLAQTPDDILDDDDLEQLREDREHLFSELLVLRDDLAAGDPTVLNLMANPLLDKLVDELPSTVEEFSAIDGVGRVRATKCGKQFVEKINEVVGVYPSLKRQRAQPRPAANQRQNLNLRRFQSPASR